MKHENKPCELLTFVHERISFMSYAAIMVYTIIKKKTIDVYAIMFID